MSEWKHEITKDTVLYKYRTFAKFENVVDIIVNRRLYAASYDTMNDPLEGSYGFIKNAYPENGKLVKKLDKAIQEQKFCSLSKSSSIDLMWGHYADGHRGICFGVKLKNTKMGGVGYQVRYEDFPNLSPICDFKEVTQRAQRVLRYKTDCWDYEDEVRLFSNKGHLVDVDVVEVILGRRAAAQLVSLVKKLCAQYLPNAKVISLNTEESSNDD